MLRGWVQVVRAPPPRRQETSARSETRTPSKLTCVCYFSWLCSCGYYVYLEQTHSKLTRCVLLPRPFPLIMSGDTLTHATHCSLASTGHRSHHPRRPGLQVDNPRRRHCKFFQECGHSCAGRRDGLFFTPLTSAECDDYISPRDIPSATTSCDAGGSCVQKCRAARECGNRSPLASESSVVLNTFQKLVPSW